ncbi:hypothetical protein SL034_001574 [Vibrio harveyi]|uniref:hypothetical protein n=1 Tax=Vibrio harveyi TaxID=669 RepID=UPI000682C970|nr:hypothetical protein [Vibrio harveyi]ELY1986551.1 hypothetical protein [Vibrio harveyi]
MAEKEMEYQGCKGIKSISTKFGIAESTLRHRLYTNGNDIEKAVNYVKYSKVDRGEYEYQGAIGLKEISKKFDINYNTLRQRLSKGMSLKDAIETKVKNRGQAKKKIVEKPEVELVGIKAPDQLNNSWKLALGMGGSL